MAKITITIEDTDNGLDIQTEYDPPAGREESIAQEVGAAVIERVQMACKSLAVHSIEETDYDNE